MRIPAVIFIVGLLATPMTRAEDIPPANDALVDKIIRREQSVTEDLANFHPVVETYAQVLSRRDGRLVPKRDRYFLSVAQFSGQLRALRFKPRNMTIWRYIDESGDAMVPNDMQLDPSGFVAMAYPSPGSFDREHYHFKYLRKEFLGEVRCLVFDVSPLSTRYGGMFEGRIWVEDRDFTIVRYNGVYKTSSILVGGYLHFDSWRMNVAPGTWVPAVIYSEDLSMPCCGIWKLNWTKFRVKSQTRFWGYNLHFPGTEAELAKIVIDPSTSIRDQSSSAETRGVFEQKRAWEREAEDNVADQLERTGLLAPPGDVDKTLQTIVNNIEVTNNLSVEPEVRCRVLMTSRLESIVVGHTIIVSRGLMDILPNETTLAALLAHQLAHVQLDHSADKDFAFADMVMFPTRDTFRKMHFSHSDKQEKTAASLAQEWMTKSPYKDSLDSITQFSMDLRRQSFHIYYLLKSDLGDSAYDTFGADRVKRKTLKVAGKSQIPALPLGSRIIIDPWSDKMTFLRAKQDQSPSSVPMPFELMPFSLYLRRVDETKSAEVSSIGSRD